MLACFWMAESAEKLLIDFDKTVTMVTTSISDASESLSQCSLLRYLHPNGDHYFVCSYQILLPDSVDLLHSVSRYELRITGGNDQLDI